MTDSEKFDSLPKYIKWLEEKVNSLDSYMDGKDPNKYPCMECERNAYKDMLAKAKYVKYL